MNRNERTDGAGSGVPSPARARRLRRRGRGVAAGVAVVLALVVPGCSQGGAESAENGRGGASAQAYEPRAPEFDADAAFELLRRQVEFGPRVAGTAGHAAQLQWMTSYLRERADTVLLQRFEHTGPADERVTMTNMFARFALDRRDRVLLLAHWDTRPTADSEMDEDRRRLPIPGANDGASGVAVLLQLADVLFRHSPPVGVDILLVDGEDYAPGHMYLGAKHFARNKPFGYEPLYGILLDMVGDQDPIFLEEPNSKELAPEVVERVWRTAERLGLGRYFPRRQGIPVTDDHIPLNDAGIRTIDIIDFDYGPANAYWHTLDDDLPNVSPEGLGVVGRVVAELVYRGG